MPKVKLISSYLDNPAGTIYETDFEKCQQLVDLGRAEWVEKKKPEKKKTKEMKPARKKRTYKTKTK